MSRLIQMLLTATICVLVLVFQGQRDTARRERDAARDSLRMVVEWAEVSEDTPPPAALASRWTVGSIAMGIDSDSVTHFIRVDRLGRVVVSP